MRALVLAFLAACWASYDAPIEAPQAKPRVMHFKPRCFSTSQHKEMPAGFDVRLCAEKMPTDDYWYCMFHELQAAQVRLEMWVDHWFEVCEPMEMR